MAKGCSLAAAIREAVAAAARRLSYRHSSIAIYKGLGLASAGGDDLKNLIETWTTEESIVEAIVEYVGNGDWIRFTTKEVLEISAPDGRTKEATDTWLLVHGKIELSMSLLSKLVKNISKSI